MLWFHLYKANANQPAATDSKSAGAREEDAGEGRKGTRKLSGVTDSMFIIPTAVAVSQVYGYVRTYQTVPFKYVQLVVCL